MSSFIVVNKLLSREIIILSGQVEAKATTILLCRFGPALYSKGFYLDQSLLCSLIYRTMLARSDKTWPARFATSRVIQQLYGDAD